MDFQSKKSFGKLRLRAMYVEACQRCQRLSSTSSTCFNIHSIEKPSVSAFQNFFRIENPLSIKEVMSQNVCACSYPTFDIFNIHSITALRCI